MILGDPTQMHHILLNLCVNARDAMPDGGSLTVSVENSVLDEHRAAFNIEAPAGSYVKISVTDSGTGMTSDTHNASVRVWRCFRIVDASFPGTGASLIMVCPGLCGSCLMSSVYGFLQRAWPF
jgi:signal transduction histidine kinase